MRENCTYGSMRDILRAEGESRSDALAEVRAFPTGRPALLYTLGSPARGPLLRTPPHEKHSAG